MTPLSAVALLVLCATPTFTSHIRTERSQQGFQSSFSNGYHAVSASNSAPVVHTKSSYKGCTSATGCGSVTLENGKITQSSGNPAALGLANGENLDPTELHKKFQLQAENINSAFGASLPLNGPLWWMGQDSPFKDSFEAYQKFMSENGLTPQFPSPCGTPSCPFGSANNKVSDSAISNSVDISSNPFLNGQFASSAGFSGSASNLGSSNNGFLSGGSLNLPGFPANQIGGSTLTPITPINIDSNPFLSGAFSGATAPGCGGGKAGSCGLSSGSGQQLGGQVSTGFQQTGGQVISGFPQPSGQGSTGFQSGGQVSTGFQSGGQVSTGFPKPSGQGSTGFQSGGQVSTGFQSGGQVSTGFTKPSGQGSTGFQSGGQVTTGFPKPSGQGSTGFQAGGQVSTGFQQTGGYQAGGQQSTTGYQQTGNNACSGKSCSFPGQGQQQITTGYGQSQTTGCANGGSGCGFQDQQQVVTGFEQVQNNCVGQFCGNDQQTQQFPQAIPNFPPPQGIPNKPPVKPIPHSPPPLPIPNIPPKHSSGLPHPPGATAGDFTSGGSTSGELTVTCSGQGNICVQKHLCVNGYVNDNGENIFNVRSGVRCKASTEVCCRFKPQSPTQTTSQTFSNDIYSGATLQSDSFASTGNSGLIHIPGSAPHNTGNQFNTGLNTQKTTQNGYDQTGFTQQSFNTNTQQNTLSSQSQDQGSRRPKFGNVDKLGTPYLPPVDTPKPYVYPEPQKPFNPTTARPIPSPSTYKPFVAPTTKPTTRYVPPQPTRPPTRPPQPYLPPDENPQASIGSQQIVPRPIQENEGGLLLDESISPNRPPVNIPPAQIPSACAAALKCTPIEFCTADGIISNTTVFLTREQNDYRVPLTDCREPSNGVIGKCCRDPTYTDPWPTNQLGRWIPEAFGDTGAYKPDRPRGNNQPRQPINGFGSNPAGSINNPVYTNPNKINPSVQLQTPVNPGGIISNNQPKIPPRNQNNYPSGQTILPGKDSPVKGRPVTPQYPTSNFGNQNPSSKVNTENIYSSGQLILSSNVEGNKQQNVNTQAGGTCGARRTGTRPFGNKDLFEADFAEIPWQAMVLLQTNRSLLCGGVITAPDIVVTSAKCIDGLDAKNVLIKGGEWKLGIDEEPLPFQIVQVAKIHKHPEYFSGSLQNDLAILVLAEKLRLAANIEPICLPPTNQNAEARLYKSGGHRCITTGWGKQVLQINIPNSVMHTVDMNLIPPQQCQAQITQNYPHLLENYNPNTCICGQPGISGANVCKVDIGSALACTDGDGVYYMEGVYSWDAGCNSPYQLASFYKFDSSWYHSALSGKTDIQSQIYQNQQFIGGNNGGGLNVQAQRQQQGQQGQYQSQFQQNVYKQGRSYAVNGQKAFEQALGGHVHAAGEPCQCFEGGK